MRIRNNIAISETGFIFDPGTGDSYTLNAVGMEIFGMLKSGRNQEEISQIITDRYDVEESAFERYFYDFVSMLKHYQILEDNE